MRRLADDNMDSASSVSAATAPDELLARKRVLDARAGATAGFAARLREVRTWQATRLARTYDDFRTDPQYTRAIEFFLSDLSGPQDLTRRDHDLSFAWTRLKRTLPQRALNVLTRAVPTGRRRERLALSRSFLLSAPAYRRCRVGLL